MDSVIDRSAAERAGRACDDWKRIVHSKSLEALKLEDTDPDLRFLRARRLAAWRDLSLDSAAEAIGGERLTSDFKDYAVKEFNAAFLLLNGGEPPKIKSFKDDPAILLHKSSCGDCAGLRSKICKEK